MTGADQLIREIELALDKGHFTQLFGELLGWSNPKSNRPFFITSDEGEVEAIEVAQKKGLAVMLVKTLPATRKSMDDIDRELAKRAIERIVVFVGEHEHVWRWPEARKAGGVRYMKHVYRVGKRGQALPQRLAACKFTLAEEPGMNIIKVRERIRTSFNSDEVTRRFYTRFKQHQSELAEGIKGLKTESERSWYSSLLLNRLMFIYFMQKKGFLNNDPNYLRNSLQRIQELNGKNRFFEFYRDFLLPLFHDELGEGKRPDADPQILEILGDVPYINGGIFAEHALESAKTITIKDTYFSDVFDFFDQFRWHLDERPSGNPGEINPDVIGYIFEQYINQKQQGAYYTKEDVTGYMTTSALVPVVIDRFLSHAPNGPWSLLSANPDAYIFESLRYGSDFERPTEILEASPHETGILDTPAPDGIGLPGERWRESIDRLDYYIDVRSQLERDEVENTCQLVTLNLDLLTLLCDWIGTIDDPSSIARMWTDLLSLNVIDPTCGSGAFLFAALDVLEEIYMAVLTRAEDLSKTASGPSKKILMDLTKEMNDHSSVDYFLLKTIVLENLYGVDIMVEATEIARLRLFLALVARLDRKEQIEPLPDLDMNIKVGNILVGCSTFEDAKKKFAGSLFIEEDLKRIEAASREMKIAYDEFVQTQRSGKTHLEIVRAKTAVQQLTSDVRGQLDSLYFNEVHGGENFDDWRANSLPFHWFIEFPETMLTGGFDVVVGNPPYIQKRKISSYRYQGFTTDTCPDIYAPCFERSASILRPDGMLSMIVPISSQFSEDFETLRSFLSSRFAGIWVSSYSRRPSALFDAGVRPSIYIAGPASNSTIWSGSTYRWWSEFRPHLLPTVMYVPVNKGIGSAPWPRRGNKAIGELFDSLQTRGGRLEASAFRSGEQVGFKLTALYFLSVFKDDPPAWDATGQRTPQTKIGHLSFGTVDDALIASGILAGRLATVWWYLTGDDFDVTKGGLLSFPVDLRKIKKNQKKILSLSVKLRQKLPQLPLVTRKAGLYVGNYRFTETRHITDEIDQLVLDEFDLKQHWSTVLLLDAKLNKTTEEGDCETATWPFSL